MARQRSKKLGLPSIVLAALLALACLVVYIASQEKEEVPVMPAGPDALDITALDVGQADAVLLRLGELVMLVDAGGRSTADALVSELKDRGVQTIDVLIGTHPHEDHIGGMAAVIRSFKIRDFYLSPQAHTTQVYEDLLDAALDTGLNLDYLKAGGAFGFGEASVTVLAPLEDEYKELNNASVVCRVDYAGRSVLLTGDAEELSEKEMLSAGRALRADVLKVGHHGSDSSTSEAFLRAVRPSIALISCGVGNSYGHPSQKTLDRLLRAGAAVYRTDLNGTVTVLIAPDGGIEVSR